MSGVSSLSDIVDMASGKISAGGMSLQDILKASGITLSSAGDGEGEYEDSDTDDSMNGEEGAKVRRRFLVFSFLFPLDLFRASC
jgi:hypothetical protein